MKVFKRFKELLKGSKQPVNAIFNDKSFVQQYSSHSSTDVLHALYERKETLALVGDTRNKSVLIVGSGPGIYAEQIAKSAEKIICLDASPEMHAMAKRKLGDQVEYLLHDLNLPIPLEHHSFDLIVSPLTIHYVEDWHALFGNFFKLLSPGGKLVFSTMAPMHTADSDYHSVTAFWQNFEEYGVRIKQYKRPLSEYINPIVQSGFVIKQFVEPKPSKTIQQANAHIYQALQQRPLFIFVELEKP